MTESLLRRGPEPPERLAGLPVDRRGFIVPAEAGWDDNGPEIKGLGQSQTFGLGFMRACAVCGYRLGSGELVWRLYTQAEASSRRTIGGDLYEPANPGHLVCMLYASQVCPFWGRPEARLGKDSLVAPGARRGKLVALMGFSDYEMILPVNRPVEQAAFMYHDLVEDVRFREPTDLAERFNRARGDDQLPAGARCYWTNTEKDLRRLDNLLMRGRKSTQRAHHGRTVNGPGSAIYRAFTLPLQM